MINLQSTGRILFAIPFGIFGLTHFIFANQMKEMVPTFFPGGIFWVYITGTTLVAATVSIISEKQIYLSSILLAVLMSVFIFTIWIPGMISGNQMAMSGLLKDSALAGGALLVAGLYRKSD